MSWFGYGGSGRRSGGTPNFVMITKAYGPAFAPYPGQVEKMNKGGDKVLLSGGILEQISNKVGVDSLPQPIIFSVTRDPKATRNTGTTPPPRVTHVGVLEFSLKEPMAIFPSPIMENLGIDDGATIELRLATLPRISRALLKPLSAEFAKIDNPKIALQHAFTLFTCLTEGDIVSLPIGADVYKIEVKEVYAAEGSASGCGDDLDSFIQGDDEQKRPDKQGRRVKAACLINADLVVEIDGSAMAQSQATLTDLALDDPLSGELKADEYAYMRVKLTDPDSGLQVTVESKQGDGDPDLYISTKTDRPSLTNCEWSDTRKGTACVTIRPNDPNYSKTWYWIAVHAYKKNMHYTITTTRAPHEDAQSPPSTGYLLRTTSVEKNELKNDPTMDYCANCNDYIPKMAMRMHSLRCVKQVFTCTICKKVLSLSLKDVHVHCPKCSIAMDKGELDKHLDITHRVIVCACGSKFEPSTINQHKETSCSLRSVPCVFCSLAVPFKDKYEHETACGSKTVPCDLCKKLVVIKRMDVHKAVDHGINPSQIDVTGLDWKGDPIDRSSPSSRSSRSRSGSGFGGELDMGIYGYNDHNQPPLPLERQTSEEMIAAAIAASLNDAGSNYGSAAGGRSRSASPARSLSGHNREEDELAKAIAESLRMSSPSSSDHRNPRPSTHANGNRSTAPVDPTTFVDADDTLSVGSWGEDDN